jgi:hypothetical protein
VRSVLRASSIQLQNKQETIVIQFDFSGFSFDVSKEDQEAFSQDATKEVSDRLKEIIDQHGLHYVLNALSEICAEKADHLSCNWQDPDTAKAWMQASKKIDKVAETFTSM